MNIVLIGYMGCGKSSIGKSLAKKLRKKYLDLDDYIENREGKTVYDIFKNDGEIYFRKKETIYLKELIENRDNIIISLGGGTPCFSGNMEMIIHHKNVNSFYLQTSINELVSRLFSELGKRPLIAHIKSKDELQDFIRKHLFERSFFYNQSKNKIITDNKTIEEISEEIYSHNLHL